MACDNLTAICPMEDCIDSEKAYEPFHCKWASPASDFPAMASQQ